MVKYVECDVYRAKNQVPPLKADVRYWNKILLFPIGTKESDVPDDLKKYAYVVQNMYYTSGLVAVKLGCKCAMGTDCFAYSKDDSYELMVGKYPIAICE